jgi:hypothetical protein
VLRVILACPSKLTEERSAALHASLCAKAVWLGYRAKSDDYKPIGVKPQYALLDPALVGRDVHFVEKRIQERRIASDMIIGADDRHRRIVIDYKQRPAALSSDLHGVLGEFSPAAATLVRPDPKDEFREPRGGAPRLHGELLKLGIIVAQSTVSV